MRRLALGLLCLVLFGSGLYSAFATLRSAAAADRMVAAPGPLPPLPPGEVRAGVVHDPATADGPALAAWTQILQEEGFPYETLTGQAAADLGGAGLAGRYAALIVPDEAGRALSDGAVAAIAVYVQRHGGRLLTAFDAATATAADEPRPSGAFTELIGADYWRPGIPAGHGVWRLPPTSPLRAAFDPGLFNPRDTIQVYGYPELATRRLPLRQVIALPLAFTGGGDGYDDAAVLEHTFPGGGTVLYANGDLAYHKYHHNDDFLLRDLLRFFLLRRAGLPRLVAAPGGVGGLLLNIHVCSGQYYADLAKIQQLGLFRPDLRYSFHITAGPDNDQPGDGRGVGADGPRGRALVQELASHGNIGSQGGWIHNYWALQGERLPQAQIDQYINRNYAVLAAAAGRPVLEYSAPGGLHSAHVNDLLAAWGTTGAAIPNSFFSPPTHAWWDGKREERFWLFGYTGTHHGFALENMLMQGRSPAAIGADIEQLLGTVVRNREIRQFYTHPGSIAQHPELWQAIQDSVQRKIKAGRLTVRPMADYAAFLNRRARVTWHLERTGRGYHLAAAAPDSLQEMTFALPAGGRRLMPPTWGRVEYAGDWAYLTVTSDIRDLSADLS